MHHVDKDSKFSSSYDAAKSLIRSVKCEINHTEKYSLDDGKGQNDGHLCGNEDKYIICTRNHRFSSPEMVLEN